MATGHGEREPVVCGIPIIKNNLRIKVYTNLASLVAMTVLFYDIQNDHSVVQLI